MKSGSTRTLWSLLLCVFAVTSPVLLEAQSLTASRGLGVLTDPAGARAYGLGGSSIGLLGSQLDWSNPAAAVNLPAPTLALNFQLDGFEANLGNETVDGNTARFPLIHGGTRVGRLALTAGYGGFLDQNWAVERRDTLVYGADSTFILDRFASEGGVARLRLGAGYSIIDGLAVGLGFDLYTGSLQRTAGRSFGNVNPDCCTARWNYSGTGMLASVDWSPSEAFRVAAAVESGTTLTAEPQDTFAVHREFSIPVSYRLGASGRVAPDLLIAVSGRYQGWSELDADLQEVGGAGVAWAATGGVEWDGASILGRPLPLRVGGRIEELPFRWEMEPITDQAITFGTGIQLAGGAALVDLSAERGTRSGDAAFEESYWRFLFSVRVLSR